MVPVRWRDGRANPTPSAARADPRYLANAGRVNEKLALVAALLVLSGGCSDGDDADLPVVHSAVALELGVTYRHRFYIHYGMKWLQSFNGTPWVTDDPIYGDSSRPPPDDLRRFLTNPDEVISPELWTHSTLVAEDEIRLTLPDGWQTSTYHATDDE